MTSSNPDDIFRDLYQTADEVRQASRAINIAYERLQALRDNLTSFAAQRDRLRSRQSSDDEHDRLSATSRRRLSEQNIPLRSTDSSPSEFVSNSRRRRSIHPSSSLSGVGANALSIHTRRSMLESHLRSIRRILESSLSTTYLERQTIQRVTADSADSDQHNEDSSLDQYPSSSSSSRVIESRAAAAHLRLSFLPNPTSRSSNTRPASSLTRTRTIRSNSETALTRPPNSSNSNPPLSRLSAYPSNIPSEGESTNHLFNDFVRMYWPQRQEIDQLPDTVFNPNTFTSDSEDLEQGYHSSRVSNSSSQATETDDTMIIDSMSGYGRRNSSNSTVRLDPNGDEIVDNIDQTIWTDPILSLGYNNTQPRDHRSRVSPANIVRYTTAESIQIGSSKKKARESKVKTPEKAIILKRLFNPQPDDLYIANNPLPGRFPSANKIRSNLESNRVVVRLNTIAGR